MCQESWRFRSCALNKAIAEFIVFDPDIEEGPGQVMTSPSLPVCL